MPFSGGSSIITFPWKSHWWMIRWDILRGFDVFEKNCMPITPTMAFETAVNFSLNQFICVRFRNGKLSLNTIAATVRNRFAKQSRIWNGQVRVWEEEWTCAGKVEMCDGRGRKEESTNENGLHDCTWRIAPLNNSSLKLISIKLWYSQMGIDKSRDFVYRPDTVSILIEDFDEEEYVITRRFRPGEKPILLVMNNFRILQQC